ncbi:YD repeat-containing protein [Hathewaya proteolytica DSM 3090]|uniref:YD repeat-containing protein n=1 Tax=Hathewaya proteolytica DSM 3090 TaxID=1121331 RepID=A0A1M6MEL5_9CLOT|nr:RHS repeat domain-containing protein [Hathewaya proteolytica]SHJ81877.1 YD repeat-containing protein [Hathewaya proteolytica DSM 3090]
MNKKIFFLFMCMSFIFIFQRYTYADTYHYDELNRLITVTFDNGNSINYSYDPCGNILSTKKTVIAQEPKIISLDTGISGSTLNLNVGQYYTLHCTAKFDNGQIQNIDKDISYTSSNKNIISVDNLGNISAISSGSTNLIILYKGFTVTLTINILDPSSENKKQYYENEIIYTVNSCKERTLEYESCDMSSLERISYIKTSETGKRTLALNELIKLEDLISEVSSMEDFEMKNYLIAQRNELATKILSIDKKLYNKELELHLDNENVLLNEYETCDPQTIEEIQQIRDSYEGLRNNTLLELLSIQELITQMTDSLNIEIASHLQEKYDNMNARIIAMDTRLYNKELDILISDADAKLILYENSACSTQEEITYTRDTYEGERSQALYKIIEVTDRITTLKNSLGINVDEKYNEFLSEFNTRIHARDNKLAELENQLY